MFKEQAKIASEFEEQFNEPEKKEQFSPELETEQDPVASVIKEYASKLPPTQRAKFAEIYLERVKATQESRSPPEPEADSKAKFLLNRVDSQKKITDEVLKHRVKITPK